MILSSTCILKNAMPSLQMCLPCIFVIFAVSRTSLQSSVIGNADFRDLEFSLIPCPDFVVMPYVHVVF